MRPIDADKLCMHFEELQPLFRGSNLELCDFVDNTIAVIMAQPTIEQPQWISVEDGLPETIACSAGTAYSEVVNVLTSGRKVITALFDGEEFICDAEFWGAEYEEVTHWTPVLLPLPQPQKGDE